MIKYIVADATQPVGDGIKLILHICNDIGAWGAGFVMALSRKWEQPEAEYRRIPAKKRKLGYVQFVPVGDNTYVVNMIAQHNIRPNEFGVPMVRYGALETCLNKVVDFARSMDNGKDSVTLHMPPVGCGLGGGKWGIVKSVLAEAIPEDIVLTVYDRDSMLEETRTRKTIGFSTSYGSIPQEDRDAQDV